VRHATGKDKGCQFYQTIDKKEIMKPFKRTLVRFYFKRPDRIPPATLDQIRNLINRGGGVGMSYVKENLKNAFMIGYALDHTGKVVGTVTHKHQQEGYRREIERATGLDLSGYLERGYTTVEPGFGYQRIADRLIKGLIEKSEGRKIYVTIRMDNIPALKLTYKNGMALAAEFTNKRTGQRIGVFTNQP
jgi:hypothetical protein